MIRIFENVALTSNNPRYLMLYMQSTLHFCTVSFKDSLTLQMIPPNFSYYGVREPYSYPITVVQLNI